MKQFSAILFFFSLALFADTGPTPILGTWCSPDQGLILTFTAPDSLYVINQKKTNTKSVGTFIQSDSLLTASITTNDISMVMSYVYRWKTTSIITARILCITMDGDSIDHPTKWMTMKRCSPDSQMVRVPTRRKLQK